MIVTAVRRISALVVLIPLLLLTSGGTIAAPQTSDLTAAREALATVRARFAPDRRVAVFDLKVERAEDALVLVRRGRVGRREAGRARRAPRVRRAERRRSRRRAARPGARRPDARARARERGQRARAAVAFGRARHADAHGLARARAQGAGRLVSRAHRARRLPGLDRAAAVRARHGRDEASLGRRAARGVHGDGRRAARRARGRRRAGDRFS